MERRKVVVVGATGSLGSKIAQALIERGAEVTAMVRATSNRGKLEAIGVGSFVVGDMMDAASLQNALSPQHGFDAIVASAAGYTRHTKGDNSRTDTVGYRNLVDAVKNAGIPRFVLISILECDKAVTVPHFYNKHLIEQYLRKWQQPFIALRPGAFFDWSPSTINKKLADGALPVFFTSVDYGTINTSDLARYAAAAAIELPDSELNSTVDVGWSTPVNANSLAAAFSKVLGKTVEAKPVMPSFVMKALFPVMSLFSEFARDMRRMVKWVNGGQYVSKETQRQKKLFGDLPTIEEAVSRYCRESGLIT